MSSQTSNTALDWPSALPILIGGLVATGALTFVIGVVSSWPLGILVGLFAGGMTLAVAWGIAHPPDPIS